MLSVDLMYIFGLTFLVTVSWAIRFRRRQSILNALKQVMKIYKGQGHSMEMIEFNVRSNPMHTILADNEFQVLREYLEDEGVHVDIVSKDEHVPEVERQNNVIKERVRAIIQTPPYNKMPKKIHSAVVSYVVYCLNYIPKEGQDMSPREMILGGSKLDYQKMCNLPVGANLQVHNDNQVTNTIETRTTRAINLGPAEYIQGGHKFLDLSTVSIIRRRSWTELPIPSDVILRLEEMSNDQKMK
jgi:hypothetical protein